MSSETIPTGILFSTRGIHSLMVPTSGDLTLLLKFQLLGQAPQECDASVVAIVVDPHRTTIEQLALMPSRQIWWFLDPIGDLDSSSLASSPHLLDYAAKVLEERRACFSEVGSLPSHVIVSDESSASWVRGLGMSALLTQPPVSDALFLGVPEHSASIVTLRPISPHSALFFRPLENNLVTSVDDNAHGESLMRALKKFSLGLSIGASVQRGFPYEAAVHLAAGHALLSDRLEPLHGLEPGIDYFEFASPEEVFHLVSYLERSPEALHLMRHRGHSKAEYFRASLVWPNIVEGLGNGADFWAG